MVAQAQRSKVTVKKQTTGVTPDGLPVHSFRTLLAGLATLARDTTVTAINPLYPLSVATRPLKLQQKAFDLLGVGGGASGGRLKRGFNNFVNALCKTEVGSSG